MLAAMLDPRVQVDNGYSVWSIEYATGDRTSLATVTIPSAVDPPSGGWPIIANNHGTTGVDDACKLAGTAYGAGLAGLFGARGMISVASDYPGIGTPGVHPYLVSESEARAVLDGLRAARALARWQTLHVSERFGVVGLSQGGHATLAAAALHKQYAPELDIRAFAAVAPASLWEEHWRQDISTDGPQLIWHAMLAYAWTIYYGYQGPSPWAAGIEPTIKTAMTSSCVQPINGSGALLNALGVDRSKVFNPAFLLAYESGNWGAYASFSQWFSANRIGPYAQTAPLKVYQGDADVVVRESNTRALIDALRAGGVNVDYEVVPGGTHIDIAFGDVALMERRTNEAIAWVRAIVESPAAAVDAGCDAH
jgi:pimeloyl-ACP methyl ester carboxylesterase